MKHLIISEYGLYLGLEAGRLVVKNKEDKKYFPLNRLATVSIAKKGVSFSSDLIEQFSLRGIKLFFWILEVLLTRCLLVLISML
ncbi:CRISPR-associated protein Cas1 [Francisella hispaniensis]|uniref:CRISPR-associated protein Cas1 n=1 Tax=Francisella hispaniensis TaxID=622488 RepID=F4BG29_9GAMM|nr:CRISPR-associated endonuclease Cas1 [Francisella hispaniensis]AEE26423.1 CRISPR-associated protein Cas1 [Francisella hispaniensis]